MRRDLNQTTARRLQSKKRIVIGILGALCVLTVGQFILNWYAITRTFIGPSTRLGTFNFTLGLDPEGSVELILNVGMLGIAQALADALLVKINSNFIERVAIS